MFLWGTAMKKLAIGLFAVLAGIVTVSAAALVPLQQASAQQSNTVTATQSNSFSASVSQSISQQGTASGGGSVSNTASQGFCLQANQQNAAAGNDATNTGSNTIAFADCS
jgi:hypothetical protein